MRVIRAGTLIDGTGTEPRHDQAVYVEDERIVEVGPGSQIASDADVLDLREYSVLPGLIDAHVHLVFSAGSNALGDVLKEDDQQLLLRGVAAARQALRGGVTSVRDLGGRGGVTFRLRDGIAQGIVAGPRILAAGAPITITGGHCHFLGLEANGEAEVRAAARGQLKAGANCLKIMSTGGRMTPGTNTTLAQYTVAELTAAVEEAARAHVPLAAHALGTDGIRNATAAGVTTIEHCNWLGPDGRVEFDESVAQDMAAKPVAVVATLTPLQRSAPTLRDEIMECMRRMRHMGVPFVAGTDAGVSLLPFDSLPRELEIMVEDVGMTPLEAINAATGRSAEILGISSVGTLERGRYADMLVVEGDPSRCVSDVRSQRMVLKGGAIATEHGVLLV